jgi:hypothetical protein
MMESTSLWIGMMVLPDVSSSLLLPQEAAKMSIRDASKIVIAFFI